jgi:transcriptional regulator with XRE-family HTH domain
MKRFSSERLKMVRVGCHLSMDELSRRLFLASGKANKTAICAWEQGRTLPSVENLAALSDIFNVPVDYFFANGAIDYDASLAACAMGKVLPSKKSKAFIMLYLNGHSVEAIAKAEGISVETARMRIRLAKRALEQI